MSVQATAAPAPAEPTGSGTPRAGMLPRLVATAVVPVYVAGVVVHLVLDHRLGGPGLGGAAEGVILWTGFGLFAVMGALIVATRPRNAVGWVMVAAALLVGLGPTGDSYAAWVMTTRGHPDALAVVGAWVQGWYWFLLMALVLIALPLLFPDGRLPSPHWRWFTLLPACGVAGVVSLGMLGGTLSGQDVDYRIDNPIGIDGLAPVEELPVFPLLSGLFALGFVKAVAAVVVRFRRSRGDERQQMKWFLFAIAPVLALPLTEQLTGWLGGLPLAWTVLGLPVTVAIAVLRYRLDGIDVVLNRTLVYGLLTAVVVGVYVLVVGYLGVALRREDDLLVSLVATGIVAVLFAPLRDRLQRAVDRLLYGSRAEPYAALSDLGRRLESTLEPEAVLPTIVQTVREALRLPYAAIVLDDGGGPVATAGSPVPSTERLPLLYRSAPVGELVLGR